MAKFTDIQFTDILDEMHDTYERKNHDYGNSFSKTFEEFGVVAAAVRMNDKMERIKSLLKSEAQVKGESLRDTLMDLANYAVMTVVEIDNHKC